MKHIEAIIRSMTLKERRKPKIINGSRRRRIANGSGTRVQDVNRLLKDFDKSRKLMKMMMKGGKGRGMKGRNPFAGMPGM
jgi:signal recognition particle subunit SRP54